MNTELIQKQSEYLILKDNIATAIKESKAVIILSQDQVDKAGFYIKNFRQLTKKIEDYRKRIVQPLNDEVKSVNTFFKNLSLDVQIEEERLTKEVDDFMEEKRREQEEQRLREQKELEDAILDEAEIFNDPSVIDNIPKIEFKNEGLGNISNNVTQMRVKKWRVNNIDEVPRQYLILDETLINKIRKDTDFEDKSNIPGIEFYFEYTTRIK